MKILLLNQDWFAAELRAAGHEVMTAGLSAHHLDVDLAHPLIHIDSVIERLPWKERPDRIVAFDNSAPLSLCGLDETRIPTVFLSVDIHHHLDLHRHFHEMFDALLTAQKDYLPHFSQSPARCEWFPLWAPRYVEECSEQSYEAVFVGNLNPRLNPLRVEFFTRLCEIVPVHLTRGNYWEIFPKAKIVLNQTVKGDLNFRVFEALMCGRLLLTERSGNGLFDLFDDGVHLVTYERGNVEEAADKIRFYLAHPDEAQRIARAGRERVLALHRPEHRAKRLLEILLPLEKRSQAHLKFFSSMLNYHLLSLRLEGLDTAYSTHALIRALRAAEAGLAHQEDLTEELASTLVLAALRYEQVFSSSAGEQLVFNAAERYPDLRVLALSRIRILLNRGANEDARRYAGRMAESSAEEIFRIAEKFTEWIFEQGERERIGAQEVHTSVDMAQVLAASGLNAGQGMRKE
jgi:hypothetical protein